MKKADNVSIIYFYFTGSDKLDFFFSIVEDVMKNFMKRTALQLSCFTAIFPSTN